jgi:hypothetical protein
MAAEASSGLATAIVAPFRITAKSDRQVYHADEP